MEEMMRRLQMTIERLEKQNNELMTEALKLKENNKMLETQFLELTTRLEESEDIEHLDELESKISELESENEDLQDKIEGLEFDRDYNNDPDNSTYGISSIKNIDNFKHRMVLDSVLDGQNEEKLFKFIDEYNRYYNS